MGDLTTLADCKAWNGVATSADDALLQSLITAYSAFAQQWMGRQILTATYTKTFNGRCNTDILLPQFPVTAVSAVTIDGAAIPAQTDPNGPGFFFDEDGVILNGYAFTRGRANVSITWTAGYDTPPADLAQAINELVGLRYANRNNQGWSSKDLAGQTVSLITKDMPDSVRTIIDGWRNVVPL